MWPHRAPTPEAAKQLGALYFEALTDFTDGDMRTAVREALRTCKHFPNPAELRGLVQHLVGDTTMDDLYRLQDLDLEVNGGLKQIGPPADPARVQRMIADMLTEQRERAEKAKAWRNEDAQGAPVMSPARLRRQAKRKAALYEYAGKAEADAWLETIKAIGPVAPYTDADRRKDRAWAEKMALQARREQMMRERPERPAQGTGAAS